MATLFLGQRASGAGFSRPVAIKVVHPDLASDPSFVRMFLDEALLSARIDHPNVVRVEELGEADGTHYLVMEYVHGCTLAQLLGELARHDRRLTPALAVSIAIRLCDGLHAAHETRGNDGRLLGVVHRDVSPQNVLISRAGHTVLIDFGIAKARGRGARTEAGSVKGKLRYMPPEQGKNEAVDRRTDVYALGIVLWEMLTNRRFYDDTLPDYELFKIVRSPPAPIPPSQVVPGVRRALDEVVLSALEVDPDRRPPTAQELRRKLARVEPEALEIDYEPLAHLVAALLGDQMESGQLALPESVSSVLGAPWVVKEAKGTRIIHGEPGVEREVGAVINTLTVSNVAVYKDDRSEGERPKEKVERERTPPGPPPAAALLWPPEPGQAPPWKESEPATSPSTSVPAAPSPRVQPAFLAALVGVAVVAATGGALAAWWASANDAGAEAPPPPLALPSPPPLRAASPPSPSPRTGAQTTPAPEVTAPAAAPSEEPASEPAPPELAASDEEAPVIEEPHRARDPGRGRARNERTGRDTKAGRIDWVPIVEDPDL